MKTVLITGSTGGIGEETARVFAENGNYNIALHYFSNKEKAEELKRELSEKYSISVQCFFADFNDRNSIISMAKKVGDEMGDVYCLINNSGIAYQNLFQLTDEKKEKEIFDINLFGMMALTKEILPSMIRNKEGRIINISSMWGLSGASCEVHYSASKSAIIGFTKALSKEIGPSKITVNAVAPGFIDTKMNGNLTAEEKQVIIDDTPLLRSGSPRDVAYLCEFLASEKSSFITGQTIAVDGGYL